MKPQFFWQDLNEDLFDESAPNIISYPACACGLDGFPLYFYATVNGERKSSLSPTGRILYVYRKGSRTLKINFSNHAFIHSLYLLFIVSLIQPRFIEALPDTVLDLTRYIL